MRFEYLKLQPREYHRSNSVRRAKEISENVIQAENLQDGQTQEEVERKEEEVKIDESSPTELEMFLGEAIGTFFLVQIGCAAVCVAVYLKIMQGSWQVGVLWFLGAELGIYVSAAKSGAHLNPAVTLSFALCRSDSFSWDLVPIYFGGQMLGAFLAAVVNYTIYRKAIIDYETQNDIVRGSKGSEASASGFGDFWSLSKFMSNSMHAVFVESFATAVLTFVIFASTNEKNGSVPGPLAGTLIALSIGVLNTLFGPMTGPSINPARDLGPKLFCFLAGWHFYALTDFWVYIVGPFIGGPLGAYLADMFFSV